MTDRPPAPPSAIAGETQLFEALHQATAGIAPIAFAPGDILIKQGDDSDVAYFITQGTVQVFAETRYGTVPLATLPAPRLIGEIGVLANLPRTAGIKAATAIEAYALSRPVMLDLSQRAPGLLLTVVAQLGRQIKSVNQAIGLYTNALDALEKREFDSGILEDLARPPPELEEFAAVFRRFADQIVHKRRQQDELAAAALIQRSLLPQPGRLPSADTRFALHAHMRPAREIGGDFYEYFMLGEDHLAVAVGDICGKGVPASLFMAIVVAVLRASAREQRSVHDTIARTNEILCIDNASSLFATAFYGVLDLRTGVLEYCNCGHNAPLLATGAGVISTLETTGLPLGLYEDRSPAVARVTLAPGDALVIYSDGVTEAMNGADEEFGDDRLAATVKDSLRLVPLEMVARVFAAVDAHANGAEQSDDITCIGMTRSL